MGAFVVVREVTLGAAEAFDRVTDWARHGEAVPLTSVRPRPGGFTARTGLGVVGFDDPMDVVTWEPPRRCRLVKRGRVVTGWAEITVDPLDLGSRVTWREVAHWRGVPRVLGRVEEAAGRVLFGRVLDQLLRT